MQWGFIVGTTCIFTGSDAWEGDRARWDLVRVGWDCMSEIYSVAMVESDVWDEIVWLGLVKVRM